MAGASITTTESRMLIEFDLNHNDADALLRHCLTFQPKTDDPREDQRLRDALETLAEALREAAHSDQA
jgi:hypothetical protein